MIDAQNREKASDLSEKHPIDSSSSSPGWRIADLGVLSLWIVVVGYTIQHHEKWADEAQAWLIARDLDLRTIWFHELRYEGSPGLWHTILWFAQHALHARYGALGYIGMIGATAGAALLIFAAPFPRFIRWPLAFTYFLIYQYAVIARPYTLLPLLLFGVAILFKVIKHPGRMTLVLVMLALLSLHGTVLAACFSLAYGIEALRSWEGIETHVRQRYILCLTVMALTFLFIFIILKPTPDIEEFALKKEFAQLPAGVQAQYPTALRKLTAVISGAFLDDLAPSVLFVLLAAAWCSMRRRFLVFALPVAAMIALYAVVHGAAHHHGTAFVAAIAAIWIAWPNEQECRTLDQRDRWATRGMAAMLLCLCAVNLWDAAVVIQRERLFPYSGAEDAANYLKSVGADKGPIFGFLYGMVGVQAYFDHNILANVPTAYFHHGLPLEGTSLDLAELRRVNPEYVVAYTQDPALMLQSGIPQLTAEGYEIVHFSDGYYLYKRGVFEREVYFILRRREPGAAQTPSLSGPYR